jgi:hypothetical protein
MLLACTVIFLAERYFLKLILLNLLLTLVMIFEVLVQTPNVFILFISLYIFSSLSFFLHIFCINVFFSVLACNWNLAAVTRFNK